MKLDFNLKTAKALGLTIPPALLGRADEVVIDRRAFLAGTSAMIVAAPLALEAQPAKKTARVGVLGFGPTPSPEELARSVSTNPLWLSLRELGWVICQNLIIERRFVDTADEFRAGAADLVRLKVDVLFVGGAGLAKLLQAETRTIPIVVAAAGGDFVAARTRRQPRQARWQCHGSPILR